MFGITISVISDNDFVCVYIYIFIFFLPSDITLLKNLQTYCSYVMDQRSNAERECFELIVRVNLYDLIVGYNFYVF